MFISYTMSLGILLIEMGLILFIPHSNFVELGSFLFIDEVPEA